MADILDVTVIIKRNGRDVAGFPYQKRMVVDELQSFAYEKATGGGYETLPTTDTSVLISSADPAIVAAPVSVTIPANSLSANFTVAGLVAGTTQLT